VEDRRICENLRSINEAGKSVQVLHVLRRRKPWLVVLTQTINSSVVICGHEQRGRGGGPEQLRCLTVQPHLFSSCETCSLWPYEAAAQWRIER